MRRRLEFDAQGERPDVGGMLEWLIRPLQEMEKKCEKVCCVDVFVFLQEWIEVPQS